MWFGVSNNLTLRTFDIEAKMRCSRLQKDEVFENDRHSVSHGYGVQVTENQLWLKGLQ